MLKNVEETKDNIEGYYFEDECGHVYKVLMEEDSIEIGCYGRDDMCMYTKDIPRFIKVLQAAYDHKAST